MIQLRWRGRTLEYRQRSFQVDASGAFCGVTDYDEWRAVGDFVDERAWSHVEIDRETAVDADSQLCWIGHGMPPEKDVCLRLSAILRDAYEGKR